ncbi:MAG: carbon-phosphorus lyase complex subunit PhnI [Sneathiella sp.]|nr:carbon-phosphorus lyase complex subunit PhnI [Sneathiella sp.]
MYVAVKGGEKAIDNAHQYLAEERRGDTAIAELSLEQISEQLSHAVSRVMAEGSLFDPELAALAIKQARGDLIEAIFLIRAYRTTLPRFGYSNAIDTAQMALDRRISATFKDLPGGQILGPTFDYTHRLLDFTLAAEGLGPAPAKEAEDTLEKDMPRVLELLNNEDLIEPALPTGEMDDAPVGDLTREPLEFPAGRDLRLQNLARGDEGFILSLGYSTQRGYARNHAFVGEIRIGEVAVEFTPEELGFSIEIGDITVSECETVNQFKGSKKVPAQFTRGYGLSFGHCERKVIAMALVDRALRWKELGEDMVAPVQDEEFVLSHSDNIQATGFVEHIKLPHYVDFQSELELVRRLRANTLEEEDQMEAAE